MVMLDTVAWTVGIMMVMITRVMLDVSNLVLSGHRATVWIGMGNGLIMAFTSGSANSVRISCCPGMGWRRSLSGWSGRCGYSLITQLLMEMWTCGARVPADLSGQLSGS